MSSRALGPSLHSVLLCFGLLTAAPPSAAADLSFERALQLSLQQAPSQEAARHRYLAAQQSATAAGRLPDPELLLGLDNLPLQGADRFDLDAEPMGMRRIGLMQRFPNSGKRQAQRSTASARIALRDSALQASARQLLQDTATLWIGLHRVEAQRERLDALQGELRLSEQATLAQVSGGQDGVDTVLMTRQASALIDQRAEELLAEQQQLRAQLRRHLGEAASHALAGDPTELTPDAAELHAQLEQHPLLQWAQAEQRQMDAEVAMARADQRPDWALELGLADRSRRFGDMAMLQLRVDLPVFQGKRQQPRLAAALSERDAAEDAVEATRRELAADLDTLLAQHTRAERAERRVRETLLPLAAQRVALQRAAWESGRASLDALLAARRDHIELELEAIARRGERQSLAARLHYGFAALPSIEGITP